MPRDTPGTLNDQRALELVAYILKFNGYPSGATPLTADAGLDNDADPAEVGHGQARGRNFAVVQVVGCVTRGAGSRWASRRPPIR